MYYELFFIGFSSIFFHILTIIPVHTAEITVPSLVSTKEPEKNTNDKTIDNATHDTSKTILTFENSLCKTVARA